MKYTAELYSFTVVSTATALMWVPHVLARMTTHGVMRAIGNPGPDYPTDAPWADRARRAHINAIENLAVFRADRACRRDHRVQHQSHRGVSSDLCRRASGPLRCQSAFKFDPRIASSADVTLMAPLPMTIRCRLIGRAGWLSRLARREGLWAGRALHSPSRPQTRAMG